MITGLINAENREKFGAYISESTYIKAILIFDDVKYFSNELEDRLNEIELKIIIWFRRLLLA